MNTLTVSDKYDEASDESKALRAARNRLMDLLYEERPAPELLRQQSLGKCL